MRTVEQQIKLMAVTNTLRRADVGWRRTDVERRPTAVRRRSEVVGGLSAAPKKKHLIEAASFGRLDQMLRTTFFGGSGGALPSRPYSGGLRGSATQPKPKILGTDLKTTGSKNNDRQLINFGGNENDGLCVAY